MPTITREKAMKNQSLAPSGWTYDWKHYVLWGEHQLKREIPQDDGTIVIATVFYSQDYYYAGYTIKMHVQRWHETSTPGIITSSGFGNYIELSSPNEFKRKVYKDLCKFAGADSLDDEFILKILKGV